MVHIVEFHSSFLAFAADDLPIIFNKLIMVMCVSFLLQHHMIPYMLSGLLNDVQSVDGLKTGITTKSLYVTGKYMPSDPNLAMTHQHTIYLGWT